MSDSAAGPPPSLAADLRATFAGARVAAFESRQQTAMEQLIRKHGGQPHVSPALQELPLAAAASPAMAQFAHRLLDGSLDTVIAMTGVGFRYLIDSLSTDFPRQRILDFLSDITTIARGPKPNAAMHQMGITARYKVPPPHTWREILGLVDAQGLAANRHIALLEYGESSPGLISGLEARGASVLPVTIYRWGLPDDLQPLEDNIRRLLAGQIDMALFTSAQQVVHLLDVAQQMGCRQDLYLALARVAIASIGPTTSERLQDCGIAIAVESELGKMARLVSVAAEYWKRGGQRALPTGGHSSSAPAARLAKSRTSAAADQRSSGEGVDPNAPAGVVLDAALLADRQAAEEAAQHFVEAAWYDGPFLRACRRQPTSVTPVWLMRQAGRYMAEYQSVRRNVSFLELCKDPSLCSEVMCTAVDKLGVDAAIIFSDLLPILEPLGFQLSFGAGHGPQIHNPIRQSVDVQRVGVLGDGCDLNELSFVFETVRQTRRDLPSSIPVIGFAGAPFTLASYCIEGGSSRNYLNTKRLMYSDQVAWDELMRRLTDSVVRYLNAQVRAGAGCLQLFDSWVGALSPADYCRYVLPHMQRLVAGLAGNVPVINFGTGNPQLLPLYAAAAPAVVGVDWRIELDQAWDWIGPNFAVQGNLDPLVLLGPLDTIRREVVRILGQAGQRAGHIFNLGHGIVPETPVDHAVELVKMVHDISGENRSLAR